MQNVSSENGGSDIMPTVPIDPEAIFRVTNFKRA